MPAEAAVTQLPQLREPLDPDAVGFERDDGRDPSFAPEEEPKPRSFGFVDLARLLFTEPSAPWELPRL